MKVIDANMSNHQFTERPLNGFVPYHLIQPGLSHVESVMASSLTDDGSTLYLNKTNRDLALNKFDTTKPMFLYEAGHGKTFAITKVEFFAKRPYNTIVRIEEIDQDTFIQRFILKQPA